MSFVSFLHLSVVVVSVEVTLEGGGSLLKEICLPDAKLPTPAIIDRVSRLGPSDDLLATLLYSFVNLLTT